MAELSYEEVMGQAKTKEFSYEEVMGGVAKPKRTRQQVEAQVNKAQALRPPIETQGVIGRLAGSDLANQVVESLTPHGLANAVGMAGTGLYNAVGQVGINAPVAAYKAVTGQPLSEPILGSDTPVSTLPYQNVQQGQPIVTPYNLDEHSSELQKATAALTSLTPELAATLPFLAASKAGPVVQGGLDAARFGIQSGFGLGAMGSVHEASQPVLAPDVGGEDRFAALMNTLASLGIGSGMLKHAITPPPVAPAVRPELLEQYSRVPEERQLPERALSVEQAANAAQNPPVRVLENKPGEGQVVYRQPGINEPKALIPEKSGRTLEQEANRESAAQVAQNPPVRDLTVPDPPLSQPDYILPREQRQALPEPKFDISALSKDEQDVVLSTIRDFRTRKAQEPGKVIGEEPSYLPPTKEQMQPRPIEPVTVPTKPPVEAGGIPNARQSAGESGLVIKQDQPAQPIEMGSSLSTKPALMLRDGTIIEGKQGGMHYEILDANPKIKESDVLDGGVMRDGKYIPRNSEMTAGMNEGVGDQALVDQYTKKHNSTKQSGIGGGINKAIEGNKESGSILNPFKSKPPTKPAIGDLQRLDDYETMKKRATTAYGIGGYESLNFPKTTKKVKEVLGQEETNYQLGLGRFFDPRSGEKSPIEEALLTRTLTNETGKSLTTVRRASWDNLPDPFPVDKETGTITLADGSKGYMSDVVEAEMRNPGSQKLTKVQRDAVELAKRYNEEIRQMAEEEGVKLVEVSDGERLDLSQPYLTRPAVGKVKNGKVKEAKDSLKSRMSIGSERYYQKRRQHQSEAEGVEDGIKYMPNFYDRLAEHQKNVYRAIADQRLANDPALKGDAKYKFMENGLTYNPAFHGRYFSKEGIKAIQDANEAPLSGWTKGLNNVNNLLKAMKFTGDMSTPWNQGLPMMYSNPIRWSKATWAGFKALGNDKVLANYLALPENLRAAQRIAAKGGSIGRLEDFLAGTEKGQLAEKIGMIRASNRSMSTFLSVAKVELYKAFEPLMKKKGWNEAEMVEAIGNTLGSAKMESIGIGTRRALIERLVFNAPTFQRAAANLVAMAGKGGASGAVARKALGSLAVGIGATMYGLYYAQVQLGEMTQAEMDERLDFRSSKFMRVGWNLGLPDEERKYKPLDNPTRFTEPQDKVDFSKSVNYEDRLEDAAKEQRLEVSYGNIFLTVTRLLGDLTEIAQGDKEFGTGTKNPFIGFVANRKSPIADLIEKAVTGKDRMGNEQELYKAALQAFAPMPLENFSQKGGTKKNDLGIPIPTRQGMASFGLGLGGGASFPESFSSKRNRLADKVSQDLYKAPDRTKLGLADRLFTDKMVDDALEIVKSRPTVSQRLQSETTDLKRGQKVFNLLSPEVKDAMEKAGVEMPAIQSHKVISRKGSNKVGLPLHLTQEEQKMLVEKLSTATDSLLKEHFVSFQGNPKQRKEMFGKVLSAAKDQAWAEVVRAIMEMEDLPKHQPEPSQLLVP